MLAKENSFFGDVGVDMYLKSSGLKELCGGLCTFFW